MLLVRISTNDRTTSSSRSELYEKTFSDEEGFSMASQFDPIPDLRTFCLPYDGEFEFIINDSGGDGIREQKFRTRILQIVWARAGPAPLSFCSYYCTIQISFFNPLVGYIALDSFSILRL